jgi:hypothetical protein
LVTREAVEDEPAHRVRAGQALADQPDSQLVGNELAGREDRLGKSTELGLRRDLVAEHVAGREVRDPELGRDPSRLRSLPRARGANDEQVHFKKPS